MRSLAKQEVLCFGKKYGFEEGGRGKESKGRSCVNKSPAMISILCVVDEVVMRSEQVLCAKWS